MKRALEKIGVFILISVFPLLASMIIGMIDNYLIQGALGWGDGHDYFLFFVFLAIMSYVSFKYFSKTIGQVSTWIALSIFLLAFLVMTLYQNTIKFTIKLLPFYLSVFFGLYAGFLLARGSANKVRALAITGILPLIFSLGVSEMWVHRIEYGTWSGDVAKPKSIPFAFYDKQGNAVDNNSLQGKVVLFDFWFINCGPCWVKFPKLQELYEQYKDDPNVAIFAVNRPMKRDEPGALFSTIEEKEYTFPVLRGTQEDMDALEVYKYPTVMLLNRKGEIVFVGELEEAEIKLTTLLNN